MAEEVQHLAADPGGDGGVSSGDRPDGREQFSWSGTLEQKAALGTAVLRVDLPFRLRRALQMVSMAALSLRGVLGALARLKAGQRDNDND